MIGYNSQKTGNVEFKCGAPLCFGFGFVLIPSDATLKKIVAEFVWSSCHRELYQFQDELHHRRHHRHLVSH